MPGHDVIVIGASAGGVEVLSQLVRGLPPALPAAIFIVCHFPPGSQSILPEILSRTGPLLARHARDGEPIYPGHIYIAPPDRHLLVEDGHVRLSHGPRENSFRPAIDSLFRSAAHAYGKRVVGVVLTGVLYDGVAGLLAVRAAGGIAVIQDPQDAPFGALPLSAHQIAGADHVVPAADLATRLTHLVQKPLVLPGVTTMPDPLDKVHETMQHDMLAQERGQHRGHQAVFSCPECGGSLWQVDEQELARFSCHVGHVYLGEALLAEQTAALEAALWTAVRIFKEKTVLATELAADERRRGKSQTAARLEDQANESRRYGQLIQQYLLNPTNGPPPSTKLEQGAPVPVPDQSGSA